MPPKTKKDVVPEIVADSIEAAKDADLHYIDDVDLREHGIRREKTKTGFRYVDEERQPVRDLATLERIRALVIPPAWTDVQICALANGHIQAVGRDAKGRKQYRYHVEWRKVRSENKFQRMYAFGEALPAMRQQIAKDLALTGLPREKVLALVVRLLEATFIRVGNAEYARQNHSIGLTTMRDQHVEIDGAKVRFEFRGKSGVHHSVSLQDRHLANMVKRCKEIPGQALFQYLDDEGNHQAISSTDVNVYLHLISGEHFTAKDFRTWGGTILALRAFQELGPASTATQIKKNTVDVMKTVSAHLGNTTAVCRKYYVHPAIVNGYTDSSLFDILSTKSTKRVTGLTDSGFALDATERAVMKTLQLVSQQ
jgi:DNA topoisomerase I